MWLEKIYFLIWIVLEVNSYDFINKFNDMLKQTPCYFKTDDYFVDDEEWTSYMNEATKYGYLVIISLKKLDLSSNYIM